VILIGVLILFYWVIYGLLLRRLKRNYRELKKIEE
jgi:Na+/H+-dicarboxylate symporter